MASIQQSITQLASTAAIASKFLFEPAIEDALAPSNEAITASEKPQGIEKADVAEKAENPKYQQGAVSRKGTREATKQSEKAPLVRQARMKQIQDDIRRADTRTKEYQEILQGKEPVKYTEATLDWRENTPKKQGGVNNEPSEK